MPTDLKTLSPEYATLWDTMEIVRDAAVIEKTVQKIIAFKSKYAAIEAATNVPWYVIGIMDMREGGGGCCTHLHNGDSLKKRTVNEPKNRPTTSAGPFTWQESAIDALQLKRYDKITAWTVEQMAWCFERYNGFGYRAKDKDIPSPYLWGGTNHQAPGKYIADHVFSKTVLDPQIGCMPLLKRIAELEEIELVSAQGATSDPTESSPASNRKAEKKPVIKQISDAVKDNKEVVTTVVVGTGAAGAKVAKDAATTPDAPQAKPAITERTAKAIEDAKRVQGQVNEGIDMAKWAGGFFSFKTGVPIGFVGIGLGALLVGAVAYKKMRA